MKKIFIIFGIAFLLILISFFIYGIASGPRLFKDHEIRTIKIGKVKYSLYVSDSESKRMQGLSDVAKMPKKQGMLFVFEKADTYGFWMKDMRFPLDIIFLRGNKIVDIKQNILESTFPQIFYPISAVDAVIELNTGEIQKSGVHIGDVLKVSK